MIFYKIDLMLHLYLPLPFRSLPRSHSFPPTFSQLSLPFAFTFIAFCQLLLAPDTFRYFSLAPVSFRSFPVTFRWLPRYFSFPPSFSQIPLPFPTVRQLPFTFITSRQSPLPHVISCYPGHLSFTFYLLLSPAILLS